MKKKPTNSLTLARPIQKANKIKKSELVVSTDKLNKFRLVWNIIKSLFTIENANLDDEEEDNEFIPVRNKKSEFKIEGRKSRKLLSLNEEQELENDEESSALYKNRKLLKSNEKRAEAKSQTKIKKLKKENDQLAENSKKPKSVKNEIKIPENKKVGFEHRYRVSKYIESLDKQKTENQAEKTNNDDYQSHIDKPKVGWEHRYRISKYLQEKNDKNNNKKEAKKEENKDDNYLLIGRFKIDKTKIGPIGWQYRYRASNKFKSLAKKSEKKSKKSDKILEVVDFTNDAHIPFCESVTDDQETLINSAKDDDKEPDLDQVSSNENKPKVGWEHRYRISRMLAEKNNEPKSEKSKKKSGIKNVKIEETESQIAEKPNVGWEHRYRVSRMMQALKNTPKIVKKPLEEVEEEKIKFDENKPKVGWEHRYRISRWLNDNAAVKKTESKKKSNKIVLEKNNQEKDKENEVVESKPKVGWEYRYRVSRMLAEKPMLARQEGKKAKKQKVQEKESIENVHEDLVEKPKVGFEHRYRVSKYLSSENKKTAEIKSKKKENILPDNTAFEEKPKVGWEHRYRVSKMKNLPVKKEAKIEHFYDNAEQISDEKDETILGENKPKVGWEFRYRVSQKLMADKTSKKSKKSADKLDEKKSEDLAQKNENIGKIGFEFRYRVSNKKASNRTNEQDIKESKVEKKIQKSKKKISTKKPKEKKKITVIDEKPKVVFTIEYEKILKKDHLIKKVVDKVEKKTNNFQKLNASETNETLVKSNETVVVEETGVEFENETKIDDTVEQESDEKNTKIDEDVKEDGDENEEVKIEIEEFVDEVLNEIERENKTEFNVENLEMKEDGEQKLDESGESVEIEIDIEIKKPKNKKKQKKEKKKKTVEEIVENDIEIEVDEERLVEDEKKNDSMIDEENLEKIVDVLDKEESKIVLEQVEIEIKPNEEEEFRQTEISSVEEAEPIDEIEIKTEIKTSLSFFESIKEILANAPSFFDLEENEEESNEELLHEHHFQTSGEEDGEESR